MEWWDGMDGMDDRMVRYELQFVVLYFQCACCTVLL